MVSQNQIWTVPDNYLDYSGTPTSKTLPTQVAGEYFDNYTGDPSEYAHNAMYDSNGDLWFFIADGVVDDGEGYYIGKLSMEIESKITTGISEICIVPDPNFDHCSRFYIFSSYFADFTFGTYSYLDMSLPGDSEGYNNAEFGRLYSFDGNGFDDGVSDKYTAESLSNLGLEFVPNYDDATNFALANRQDENKYFLFYWINYRIYKIAIDQNGIHYISSDYSDLEPILIIVLIIIKGENSNHIKKAMEDLDWELVCQTVYIIPTHAKGRPSWFFDLDMQGNFITGSQKFYLFDDILGSNPNLNMKGLNFHQMGNIYTLHIIIFLIIILTLWAISMWPIQISPISQM